MTVVQITGYSDRDEEKRMITRIMCVMAVLLSASVGMGASYYVAAGSSGTGTSWSNAFGSLDAALAAAVSGDTVYVASGRYSPSGATFSAAAGVTILGGYSNYSTTSDLVLGPRSTAIGQFYAPKIYPTVLSGDTNGNDVQLDLYSDPMAYNGTPATRTDNKMTILTLAGGATVDGLVFWNGGPTPTTVNGAAIKCNGAGTLVVNNCEFFNILGENGAAIYGGSATTSTVSNCYFQGCAANQNLVQAHSGSGAFTVTACTFKGNSNNGGVSNGIRVNNGSSTVANISNVLVIDSISGKVMSSGSLHFKQNNPNWTANVTNCVFRNDAADGMCTFCSNHGSSGAGVFQTYNFTNCLWTGCENDLGRGTVIVRNRFKGNRTTVNLTNCTIADCKSPGPSAGFGAWQDNGDTLMENTCMTINIKNSILWGNSGAQVFWDTRLVSFSDTTYNPFKISYSCIDTVDPNNFPAINAMSGIPTGLVVANPQFVGNGDYHLQNTSPCIDKGDPASSYANEPKWLNGCRVNMGAYGNTKEAATTTTCVALTADTNGDCRVNNADLLTLRGQWLKTCP